MLTHYVSSISVQEIVVPERQEYEWLEVLKKVVETMVNNNLLTLDDKAEQASKLKVTQYKRFIAWVSEEAYLLHVSFGISHHYQS